MAAPATYTVTFRPYGIKIQVSTGVSLLEAARLAGVGIRSVCGGKGICGKCAVLMEAGEVHMRIKAIDLDQLSGPLEGILSCVAYPKSDCEVLVPPRSRIEGQRLQLEATIPTVDLDTTVSKVFVPQPGLVNVRGGANGNISFPPNMLDLLAAPHINGLTFTVRRRGNRSEALAAEDGDSSRECFGLAVDLGTTKIVAYLVDLRSGGIVGMASDYNRQIIYGEDLVSRIGYAMERPEGRRQIQAAAVETLNGLISNLASKAHCRGIDIVDVCAAGNTVMTYLLAGIDATPLLNPGAVVNKDPLILDPAGLGLDVNPRAEVYCLPSTSRFLGGDVIGDIVASGLHEAIDPALLVDIGTNAEVVMGCRDWFISTTAAAGPAFEGWGVRFGIRAVDGAIDSLTIDPDTLRANYSVIGRTKPKGICGSGFIDLLAEMFRWDIMDSTGRIDCSLRSDRVRKGGNGCEYVVAPAGETEVGEDITISDKEISNILDGKAAVCASISIILKKMRLAVGDIRKVSVCGAFGSHVNLSSAMAIGLIPEFEDAEVGYIGNGSIAGAYLCLVSRAHRAHAQRVAKLISYIDLMKDVDFMDEYTAAFSFPGKEELFPSKWWKKR